METVETIDVLTDPLLPDALTDRPTDPRHRLYLTQSVSKVVLQKSIPIQIRQLDLYICNSKG